MSDKERNPVLIESKSLREMKTIRHGFFTREGGVSGGIYASLNCGLGSKDKTRAVMENRRLVCEKLGVEPGALITVHQHHSADVVIADAPWTHENAPCADAIVTARPGLAIGILTADCVPVLFADEKSKVIGAAHAGWRGALTGVLEATLSAMEGLGAGRNRIRVAIGPAISRKAYEVGEEFEAKFTYEDIENKRYFSRKSLQSRPHFNLTGYVAARLKLAGLMHIDELDICTYEHESRLFSYRRCTHRQEEDYGRQISAILLP